MDEGLDDIFLVSAHDCAADPRVIWLGPEIPWVYGVAAVFERNQVVFLIAGRVVRMRHAPSGVDLSRPRIDEFGPGLMDWIPVFLKLLRVVRWRPNQLRAPVPVADVFLDVPLRDLRIRRSRSSRPVRIDVRRTDAVGLGHGHVRRENAHSDGKNSEWASRFQMAASLGFGTRIHSDGLPGQCAFRRISAKYA